MELIVVHLIEGTTPDKPPSEISTCLLNFRREMNVTHLSDAIQKSKENNKDKKKGESNEVDGYLRSIWTTLLNCATHASSSVRVAAYTATWSFLMKTMPTYPILMRNSFCDIVDHFSGESNVSILLISSFAFISNFISPNNMEDFLDKMPLFHHFVAKESLYSEHLSNIISNLSPNISNEWFKNLLLAFIKLCKNNYATSAPSRHVLKAIAALIKKNQTLLLSEILVTDEKNVFPGQLSLISFILSSSISSLSTSESVSNSIDENFVYLDNLNLKKTAIAAFDSLKSKQARSMTEIDDALSILSLRSKSFKVSVTLVNEKDDENQPKFLIDLEGHGSFVFDDQKTMQRPVFYLLPLPKEFLIPNMQSETSSIIGNKLKTLGMSISDCNAIQDVEEKIDIIDKLCSNDEYTEIVSHCLQCLSICVNSLILNTKSHKLSRLLRKLLFAKPVSWFHAFNILMVIKAIRIDLIPIVLGPSGFRDIVKTVVSFCLNMNQDLSRSSFEVIVKLTSDETFYEVTNYVAKDIDFFNSFSLQKHLLILSGLIPLHQNQDRSHLLWLFDAVIESINYHIFDIDAAASIFHFFSFFKISNFPDEIINPIIKIAKIILKAAMKIYRNGSSMRSSSSTSSLDSYSNSTVNLLCQENILSTFETNKFLIKAAYYEIVYNYIECKKAEIVSPKSYDCHTHFVHIYSVMKFLISLSPSQYRSSEMNRVLLWCFRIFPLDCSCFFLQRLKYFSNEQKMKIIKTSYPYLEAVPDIKVHSTWCDIAMLKLNLESENFKDFWKSFVRSMFEYARYYAICKTEKKIPLQSIIEFSLLIAYVKSNAKNLSLNIKKLSKDISFNSKDQNDPFIEYIQMYVVKLSDLKRIQFLQSVEQKKLFVSNFPEIIYNISAQYSIPKSDNVINDSIALFDHFVDPQKKYFLNELCKPGFEMPKNLTDNIVKYSQEKLNGWELLSFYKKALSTNISSSLLDEIKQQLNVEPRAFNPVCQQSLIMEDPTKKLQFFSDMNSMISMKTVLCMMRESFENDPNKIDFPSILFTQSMVPCIAKFIKKSKEKLKQKDESINSYFNKAEEKLESEMPLIKYFFKPDLEFKLEQNQRKFTKDVIYRTCQFMQEFRMSLNGIEQEIINNLKDTYSFNRIKALLTIATVHISMLDINLNNFSTIQNEQENSKELSKNLPEIQSIEGSTSSESNQCVSEAMNRFVLLRQKESNLNNFVDSIFTILKSKVEAKSNGKNDIQNASNSSLNENNNTSEINIIPQRELLNFAISVNNFQMHLQDISGRSTSEEKSNGNHCKIRIRRKSMFLINKTNVNIYDNNDEEPQKSSLEKNISFVDRFCNLYVFPDCMTLHLRISPRIKFEESINDIIMNSNHPSFILQSIRALRCLVAVGDLSSIRFHINDYITKFHNLQNIYPVSYYVSYFLVDVVGQYRAMNESNENKLQQNESINVLINSNAKSTNEIKNENNVPTSKMHSTPNLISSVASAAMNTTNFAVISSIRSTITSELFSSILVPISKASFYPLAKVVVALIDSETNSKTKFYTKLVRECEKIIEDGIRSFLLFKLYLEILTARIRKIPETDKHGIVAKDSVTMLIGIYKNGVSVPRAATNSPTKNDQRKERKREFISTFDSYFIDDYLSVFLKLMNEFMTFDDMINHFVSTVMPSVPRFFPSFVALAKILKQAKFINNTDEIQLSKFKSIDDLNKLLNENQSKALDEILKGPMKKEILKLSEGTISSKRP